MGKSIAHFFKNLNSVVHQELYCQNTYQRKTNHSRKCGFLTFFRVITIAQNSKFLKANETSGQTWHNPSETKRNETGVKRSERNFGRQNASRKGVAQQRSTDACVPADGDLLRSEQRYL